MPGEPWAPKELSRLNNTGRRQHGAALILVLWALAIIGVVVAAMFSRSLLERKAAYALRDQTQARSLAQAGMTALISRFLADTDAYDTSDENWYTGTDLPASADGTLAVKVADLGSRVDLNLASQASLAAVFTGPKNPSDALLDWRDHDGDPRRDGAEAPYYRALDPPLAPADGFFETPEEVLLVKGMDEYRQLLEAETTIYGRANPNLIGADVWSSLLREARIPDWENESLTKTFVAARAEALRKNQVPFPSLEDLRQLPNFTANTLALLKPYLTCQGRVNPNLADEVSLAAALTELGMPVELAKNILRARQNGYFKSIDEIRAVLPSDPAKAGRGWLEQVFNVRTSLIGINVAARTKSGVMYSLEAVLERLHPPLDDVHWYCRLIAWRECSGEEPALPAAPNRKEDKVASLSCNRPRS